LATIEPVSRRVLVVAYPIGTPISIIKFSARSSSTWARGRYAIYASVELTVPTASQAVGRRQNNP